jgi:hypothetical protein
MVIVTLWADTAEGARIARATAMALAEITDDCLIAEAPFKRGAPHAHSPNYRAASLTPKGVYR